MEIDSELIEEMKEIIQEYRELICDLWEQSPEWNRDTVDKLNCIDNVLEELDDYI